MSEAMESATDRMTEHDLAHSAPRSRFNASLVGEPLRQVEEIAAAEGVDLGEVVRRAIKLAHFVYQQQASGATFKMHSGTGQIDRIAVNYRPKKRLRSV